MSTQILTKTMKAVQIVPRLPPYNDGVGDYALRLAAQLQQAHHIETQFLIVHSGPKNPPVIDGFSAIRLSHHSPLALVQAIPDDVDSIVLHYSNYPYVNRKWEAPFWLVEALQQLKRQRSLTLVVMFHELPTLKWQQIRVINPIQAMVSRRLAQLADRVITNSADFKTKLAQWIDQPLDCIPNFSTIGEIDRVVPLAQRDRRLIVFGGSDRQRIYQNHLSGLIQTCHALGIHEIYDIGASLALDPSAFGDLRLIELGFQSAEAIRQLMGQSFAGLMDYTRFPGNLGKSSVFAAFCAQGLLPICTAYNPSEADGVYVNHHYVVAGDQLAQRSPENLEAIAHQAHTWYSTHCLANTTARFASHLCHSSLD